MIESNEHGMMKRLLEADETIESVAKELEESGSYPGSTDKLVDELRKIRLKVRRVLTAIETSTRPHIPNRED